MGGSLQEEEGGMIPSFRRLFSSWYYTGRHSHGPLQPAGALSSYPGERFTHTTTIKNRGRSLSTHSQFLLMTSPYQAQV